MRKILFRGKRIDNGEWVEGYLLLCDERVFILPWGVVGCWHFDWLKKGEYIFGKFIEVIPETIGQYTGLTDKNGKRIFEGDIVRANNGHISQVVFWHGGFCLYCECHKNHSDFIPTDIIEVIGNIHDNPELLKDK